MVFHDADCDYRMVYIPVPLDVDGDIDGRSFRKYALAADAHYTGFKHRTPIFTRDSDGDNTGDKGLRQRVPVQKQGSICYDFSSADIDDHHNVRKVQTCIYLLPVLKEKKLPADWTRQW
jgi:hypothetical protein